MIRMSEHEIGRAHCENCGKTWGAHSGVECYNTYGKTTYFHPEGFRLDEECANCGTTLEEHRTRMYCEKKEKVFTKNEKIVALFSDKDFIL